MTGFRIQFKKAQRFDNGVSYWPVEIGDFSPSSSDKLDFRHYRRLRRSSS
jgi:hypothetical protein